MSKLTPFPYQEEAIEFLVENGGGFLWDEPGLGKTLQALWAAKKLGGPVLIVCPNSLKGQWKQEISRVFPEDKIIVGGVAGRIDGIDLVELAKTRDFPFWVIVSYTGVRMNEQYGKIMWKTVVADECHYIKNRKASRSKAMFDVAPFHSHRIGLTATPFSTDPSDLWNQLNWMKPNSNNKYLRSYWRFFDRYVEYYARQTRSGHMYKDVQGSKNLEELSRFMQLFGLGRKKEVVAPQLPPITDSRMPLELCGKQLSVYQRMRKAQVEFAFPEGDDDESVRLVMSNALAKMVRMEQFLSHPWTFVSGMKGEKLNWVLEWAEGNNLPAVIATRFKASAERIAQELGLPGAITGDMDVEEREKIVQSWKSGETLYLVGTIGTIGTGLNLERAHTMVLYDQDYSTIQMEQVRHRIHRVTSDHPVQVIYLHCEGTTNDIVLESFARKWTTLQTVKMFLQHLEEK